MRPPILIGAFAVSLVLAAGCGDDDTTTAPTAPAPPTSTTGLVVVRSTTPSTGPEGTDGPAPARPETTTTTGPSPASSANTSSADTTTTTTTTTLPEPEPVELRADGLGVADLGDPVDDVVAALTEALGPPDRDTGWVPSVGEVGTCPGSTVRLIGWEALDVLAGDTGPGGTRVAHTWRYGPVEGDGPVDLATSSGFTVGSTVAELRAATDGSVVVTPDEVFGPSFVVGTGDDRLIGFLSGVGDDEVVTAVEAGIGCGG